jgi:hypothetical protein
MRLGAPPRMKTGVAFEDDAAGSPEAAQARLFVA